MTCMICGTADFQPLGKKDSYTIVECAHCQFRFAHPMPTPQVLNTYYGKYWANDKNVTNAPRKVRKLMRLLRPFSPKKSGQRFLDVGCNIGFGVEAARQLGFAATGIDLSHDAIHQAEILYPQNNFSNATIQKFSETGQQFDVVLCREVVEHLTELDSFFAALAKVTKPGGKLFLTTPDAGHIRVRRNFMQWKEVIPPEHICFFNAKTLRQILDRHGFSIVKKKWMIKPSLRVIAVKR